MTNRYLFQNVINSQLQLPLFKSNQSYNYEMVINYRLHFAM